VVTDFTQTRQWRVKRLEVLQRDGFRCQIRGPKCETRATQVDHIIPVEDGGPIFDEVNLRAACHWCNTWRAAKNKAINGWRRAATHITLVMGPPGSCDRLSEYVAEHAGPGDLVVDYRAIAAAIGQRPDEVKKLRGMLLSRLRRGEVEAARAWVTSTNPRAREMFPHHEVVVVDPGREYAMSHVRAGQHLVDNWYAEASTEPWDW
jgi:hypothetical protein